MASSDEQFSLCWNNFHANMSAGFHGLLSRGDLVDVTLAAEGRILQAHKLVLSVCSPYFQEMFKMNPNQHPIVFLKDVSHSALRDLLQFMYQGEVNVKQEELASFISTAEQLQVKGLTGNQNEESSTPSKPKPTSRPGPRSSQQRISAKLETDLDSKPSLTPVAIKRPNRPSIASNNSSSSQSGPAKRKCVDPLEAGPSGSTKDEFVTIPDEDENNAVAPKMEPEFVNESMWDDDDEGANNDETNFGEDDSNMEMSGFDGSATGDGNISGGGEGGAVGDAQGKSKRTYRKYFEKNSKDKVTCKLCSTKMNRNNMLRHFKLKHQFQFVNRLTEKKKRAHSVTAKKSSPWSKYCTEVGENQFQCIICSNVLNMPKAHGNLKRHIKFKHPSIYEKETKESLKCFWKQFGISSGVETPKKTKNNEEFLEVEEAVLGEAEYLEEYVEEEIITDETAPIIPDTDKEKNPMEEAEPEQQDSKVDTDLLSKSESVHTEIEIPIVHEITYQDVDTIEDFGKFKYLDEDDEKFEEKIKWLANTAEPEKSSLRSRLWNFFNEIRKNLYECKLCRRKLAGFTSSSSNLKRHLALVHARAYEIIANSPHFKKIPKGTIERLEKCINKPAEKSFEASYFENQGDNKYKCKVCDKVIHSEVADSVLLFKHINEEHSEEVVGGIEEPVGDEKEISVLFVKKKDLQIS